MSEEKSELKYWFYAFLLMLVLSLIAYGASLFGFMILNQIFQISVFYVPTMILALIVAILKIRQSRKKPN